MGYRKRQDVIVTRVSAPDGKSYHVTEVSNRPASFDVRQWHVVFDDEFSEKIRKLKTLSAFRVLHELPHHLSFDEFRTFHQGRLAVQLGIRAATMSNAMRELCESGLIERHGKGPHTAYRLSLVWGYRGRAEDFKRAKMRRFRQDNLSDRLSFPRANVPETDAA